MGRVGFYIYKAVFSGRGTNSGGAYSFTGNINPLQARRIRRDHPPQGPKMYVKGNCRRVLIFRRKPKNQIFRFQNLPAKGMNTHVTANNPISRHLPATYKKGLFMGLKKRVFPYTQLFQEPDAAAAFFQMGEKTNIKLLAHEIIDAFFIYENRPAAITKTICTALMMMYEAGRAAALAERPANIDALQEIRARRSEHDKAEQGARK